MALNAPMDDNVLYPYPELAELVKPLCTPAEYHAVAEGRKVGSPLLQQYLAKLPQVIYARCPFCPGKYIEPVDIYDLNFWASGYLELAKSLGSFTFANYPRPAPCKHFLGIQRFVNLGIQNVMHLVSQWPEELRRLFHVDTGEVPYISPRLFQADIPTRAILHGFPLYKASANQFIPKYTVYALTYFSLDKNQVRSLILHSYQSATDPDYRPLFVDMPNGDPKNYDLPYWVEQGRLGWLDITDPASLLCFREDGEFPKIYRDIAGSKKPYQLYA